MKKRIFLIITIVIAICLVLTGCAKTEGIKNDDIEKEVLDDLAYEDEIEDTKQMKEETKKEEKI